METFVKLGDLIWNDSVKELQKTIKKYMATGIAEKTCTALFPLWSIGI